MNEGRRRAVAVAVADCGDGEDGDDDGVDGSGEKDDAVIRILLYGYFQFYIISKSVNKNWPIFLVYTSPFRGSNSVQVQYSHPRTPRPLSRSSSPSTL